MARTRSLVTAPLRAAGAALRWAGQMSAYGGKRLTLIPGYLANLLWLINNKFLELARQSYGQNSAVYACLRLLSSSVAEPPMLAYTVSDDGETETLLPYSHPLRRLIRRPNELMTEAQFWELNALFLAIGGRAYWWKERNNRGEVLNLWPLRPDRVGPIYSESQQEGEHVISGWSYQLPGTANYLPLKRADVMHFILPDPAGESGGVVEGIGPLMALAAEVSSDNEATLFAGSLLSNSAMPGLVIKTKTPLRDEDEARVIKAQFMSDFGGSRRGMPAVIDGDSDVQVVQFTLQQMEFPALRRVSESRIAACIGTPAILVGLQVGLESGIRATISDQRKFFTQTTLSAYWRRFSDSYSAEMAVEFGENVVCRFDVARVKALQDEATAERDKWQVAFEKGTITLNEYRERVFSLPPREDGEVFYVPTTVVVVPAGQLHLLAPQPGPQQLATEDGGGDDEEEEGGPGSTRSRAPTVTGTAA